MNLAALNTVRVSPVVRIDESADSQTELSFENSRFVLTEAGAEPNEVIQLIVLQDCGIANAWPTCGAAVLFALRLNDAMAGCNAVIGCAEARKEHEIRNKLIKSFFITSFL
jgi:hypothetical protein